MIEFYLGLYLFLSAIAVSYVAKQRNRSTHNWYTCGIFFGLFALVVLLMLPKLEEENQQIS